MMPEYHYFESLDSYDHGYSLFFSFILFSFLFGINLNKKKKILSIRVSKLFIFQKFVGY